MDAELRLPSAALTAQPVILVHLDDPPRSGLAACCGQPFLLPERAHPDVPRVTCPGCRQRRSSGLQEAAAGILRARGGPAPVRPQGYA